MTFNCNQKRIKIDMFDKYIIIDNKYTAYYIKDCIDGTGGNDCSIYKNKAYTYTLFGLDDDYILYIDNIYGKSESCKEYYGQ